MSKFLLPTSKGTTLSPGVMQAPTKLRFEGVPPGSELARALYRIYAPQINGFHRQQAQKYSLSLVENYRAHGQAPGLKMTYTNLQGQETLDVRVEADAVEQVLRRKARTPPEWVVVDLEVLTETGEFAAFLTIPRLAEITAADVYPFPGVARDIYPGGLLTDIIGYAPQVDLLGSIADTTDRQIASLRVDLRPFRDLPIVSVDLYGYLNQRFDSGPVWNGADPFLSYTGIDYGGYAGGPLPTDLSDFVWLSPNQIFDPAQFLAYFPETAGQTYLPYSGGGFTEVGGMTFTNTWSGSGWSDPATEPSVTHPLFLPFGDSEQTYYATGELRSFHRRSWVRNGTGGTTDPDQVEDPSNPSNPGTYQFTVRDAIHYFGPLFTIGSIPIGGDVDGTLSAALFPGASGWRGAEHYNDLDYYYLWELEARFPERFGTFRIGTTPLHIVEPAPSDTMLNHFGMPFIGRVDIDMIHWGVSFKAA